ncbi:DMT family transporter [Rhodococcus sp. NPDC127530]|uniref:DMT family transporter n=1 Tax=unclassified Rhodococcus (in: high G+C Gram-positive bacteria) TaxID=192944 RepID=UPI00362C814E
MLLANRPARTRRQLPPTLQLGLGAAALGASGIFIALAAASTATTILVRYLIAVPILAVLAWRDYRKHGPLSRRVLAVQLVAGVLLGVDMATWAQSVILVGAGVSSVLVNIQVVVAPLLGLCITGTRPSKAYVAAVPFLLAGVALTSGIAQPTADLHTILYGSVLALVAGVCYGAYVFAVGAWCPPNRASSQVFCSSVVAWATGTVLALVWDPVDLSPGWAAVGWLAALAIVGQVAGWILVGVSLPRLTPGVGASILMLQPVLAVVLGVVVLGERLSPTQVVGVVMVTLAIRVVAMPPRRVKRPDRGAGPEVIPHGDSARGASDPEVRTHS